MDAALVAALTVAIPTALVLIYLLYQEKRGQDKQDK